MLQKCGYIKSCVSILAVILQLRMFVAHEFTLRSIFVVLALVTSVKPLNHVAKINIDRNPDINLKTVELLNKYGYSTEVHYPITEDGYILEMHRVVGVLVNGEYRSSSKGVVLLQHGLTGSSADWVIMGPGKSLAYLLADQGYDVWLGNSRGNMYSRNHTSFSPDDREFWDFSWHEMGVYDLPATIDYILTNTAREKLFYVGHSQGTTQFWVMASERPMYNEKIILMAALAPAAYTANLRGPVTRLATLTHFGVWVGENFGYPEFTPRSTWGRLVSSIICRDTALTQILCSSVIYSIAGYSTDELDSANLPVIAGHIPAGASWKQFIHYGQGTTEQGRFKKFDYENDEKNLRLYNAKTPPDYQLNNIRTPVALFSSHNDWLATPKDVSMLESKLQSLILWYKVPIDGFNHYDFLWGMHAPEFVYERLFSLLQEYST